MTVIRAYATFQESTQLNGLKLSGSLHLGQYRHVIEGGRHRLRALPLKTSATTTRHTAYLSHLTRNSGGKGALTTSGGTWARPAYSASGRPSSAGSEYDEESSDIPDEQGPGVGRPEGGFVKYARQLGAGWMFWQNLGRLISAGKPTEGKSSQGTPRAPDKGVEMGQARLIVIVSAVDNDFLQCGRLEVDQDVRTDEMVAGTGGDREGWRGEEVDPMSRCCGAPPNGRNVLGNTGTSRFELEGWSFPAWQSKPSTGPPWVKAETLRICGKFASAGLRPGYPCCCKKRAVRCGRKRNGPGNLKMAWERERYAIKFQAGSNKANPDSEDALYDIAVGLGDELHLLSTRLETTASQSSENATISEQAGVHPEDYPEVRETWRTPAVKTSTMTADLGRPCEPHLRIL
ncbi:hypothetical protein DFH09DRAFT_1093420 [Mycena vulgaris]|nr:hypothetical protein DFH09DRAFT_1093420 [Mycena vulgaris]